LAYCLILARGTEIIHPLGLFEPDAAGPTTSSALLPEEGKREEEKGRERRR
jgi:hypothetical protein